MKKDILLLIFLFIIILAPLFPVHSQSTDQIAVNNINVYPSPIYVRDGQVNVVANITSQNSLQRVWLRYGYSYTANVNQVINYSVKFMYPDTTVRQNQYWDAQLNVPSKPSFLVFYLNVTDVNGYSIIYPGANNPESYAVSAVPNATFYQPSFTLNSMTLGLQYSYANLTVDLAGVLPYPSWGYWTTISMSSLPDRYGIESNLALSESASSRFYYTGKASFLTGLSGSPDNYPYDSYVLGVNISIPYRHLNLTQNSYPVRLYLSNQIANYFENSWVSSSAQPLLQYHGNETFLSVEFSLQRSNQPIATPIISLANVTLLAAALVFEAENVEKRLTVFLTSVVISVSVLISQSLNPLGFGTTIFEWYFSYLMLANALLLLVSVIGWRASSYRRLSNWLDVFVGAIVAVLGEGLFANTPLPSYLWLSLFAIPLLALLFRFGRMPRSLRYGRAKSTVLVRATPTDEPVHVR